MIDYVIDQAKWAEALGYPDALPPGTRTNEIRPGLCIVFPNGAKRQTSGWYQGECWAEWDGKRGHKPLIIDIVPPEQINWNDPSVWLHQDPMVTP